MPARVLIVVSSRHGSTRQIAEAMREEFTPFGVDAVVRDASTAPGPEGFEAVVLGSAVYMGQWMRPARAYARRHRDALRRRRVFLFSSGPLGDPARPEEPPADVPRMMELTKARDHAVFAGRLDPQGLGLVERALVRQVGAPPGDYRRWPEIRAWARRVAAAVVPYPLDPVALRAPPRGKAF